MHVLTVDQVASRSGADRVAAATAALRDEHGGGVLLGPDRTAGDEFQLVARDAAAAAGIALRLLRSGGWSVGLGVGAVEVPLPATTREARGPAFSAARDAVEQAKRAPHRFAVVAADAARAVAAADAGALVDLLLEVRARRTAQGWEVADLLADGSTQAEAAAVLGVTAQAAGARARAAAVRLDQRAVPALVRLLAALDRDDGGAA